MSRLAVVACFFNNRREARNTLFSLTPAYQGVDPGSYDVIALDNGSSQPLDPAEVRAFGANFHHRFVPTASKSPAAAINAAVREADADRVMVLIDGAHIVTPGIFRLADEAFARFVSPFVVVPPFHLGPKRQNIAMTEGYDQGEEDRLLERAAWKEDGYRLFLVSRAFADGGSGWFGKLFEAGCFAMRRQDFLDIGGYDERFQMPGGGLVNLELFERCLARPELEYVMLLGEGSFHQFHGGFTTNTPMAEHPFEKCHEEYVRLMGRPLARTTRRPFIMGTLRDEALAFALASANFGLREWLAARPVQGDLIG
jgi:hypothetical protein